MQEDVLRLQVAVQYLLVVHVVQREADLREHVKDGVLAPVALGALEAAVEVARLAVVRHDAQVALVRESVDVAEDERVVEALQ